MHANGGATGADDRIEDAKGRAAGAEDVYPAACESKRAAACSLISVRCVLKNILSVLILSGCMPPPAAHTADTVPKDSICAATADTLRLLFAGDVMGHSPQISGAWRDGGDSCYDYRPSFQYIEDYISAADIAVANLEVTLAGKPYTGYPRFSSPQSLAEALQDAGFDVLLTANNHSLDRGRRGLERTLDVLDSIGMQHTGTFRDSVEWRTCFPLMLEKNSFRVALLNYTYGTNGLVAEKPNVVPLIDTLQIAADMTAVRALQPDFVIACIHWGEEYVTAENRAQRALAGFLAREGCGLVVGSHPHVVQPLKKALAAEGDSIYVAYSLGNFVSNQRNRYRDGGIALEVTLTAQDSTVAVHSIAWEPLWVYRYPEGGASRYRMIRADDYEAHPERYPAVNEAGRKAMMLFRDDARAIVGKFEHGERARAADGASCRE